MPLLARGLRATAGTPWLWGQRGEMNKTKTHAWALAKGSQRVKATGLSARSSFLSSYQRTSVHSCAPVLFLKVPLRYLDPTWNCTGSKD